MADSRTFREAVRSVTVSYPIPFLFAVLLAFSLTCFGLAIVAEYALRWLLAAIGTATAVASIGMATYAITRRPELLRHERIELMHRALDIIGSAEISEAARRDVSSTVVGFLEGRETRKPKPDIESLRSKDDRDG